MELRFREDKTTQAAAFFIKKSGGSINYMKLIKLLYLTDRKSIKENGRPITFDKPVSMPHGPVLSKTYDLITEGPSPREASYWFNYITRPNQYIVELQADPGFGKLSENDIVILEETQKEFGKFDQWRLKVITHNLPEYKDPNGSSLPIPIEEIMRVQGKSEGEIVEVRQDLEFTSAIDDFFHN